MYIGDFTKHNIENFTPDEISDTGADLLDVKVESVIAIQKFRTYVRRRVKLFHNGITSGDHQAQAHAEGYVIDFYLLPEDGHINIHQIYKGCLHAGFWAFGVYWNQILYSFHGEVKNPYRKDFARWIGVKDKKKNVLDWQWFSLLNDPKKLSL